MSYSKILTGIFLGTLFSLNAQNNNSEDRLMASAEPSGVIANKIDANTVLYRYTGKTTKKNVKEDSQAETKDEEIGVFNYPHMRPNQGAVLPFEIVFNGVVNSEEGIKAQENYYRNLTLKPESNNIIFQDLETTRERLHAAGIYDSQDLYSFDMPLIAKIVGAGIMVTAKINVTDQKDNGSLKETANSAKGYRTKVDLKIFDKNGKIVYSNSHEPYAATAAESYLTTLGYILKQTPFYHKNQ